MAGFQSSLSSARSECIVFLIGIDQPDRQRQPRRYPRRDASDPASVPGILQKNSTSVAAAINQSGNSNVAGIT